MKSLSCVIFLFFMSLQANSAGQKKEYEKMDHAFEEIGIADIDHDGIADTVRFDSTGRNIVLLLSTENFQPIQYTHYIIPDKEELEVEREMGYIDQYYLDDGMICIESSSPNYKYEFFIKFIYDNETRKLRCAYGRYTYSGPFCFSDEVIDLLKGKRISNQHIDDKECSIESIVEREIKKDIIYFGDVGDVQSLIDSHYTRDTIDSHTTVTTIYRFANGCQLSEIQTLDSIWVYLKKGAESHEIMVFTDRGDSTRVDDFTNSTIDPYHSILFFNNYIVFTVGDFERCIMVDKNSCKDTLGDKKCILLSYDIQHDILLCGNIEDKRYITLFDLLRKTYLKIDVGKFIKDDIPLTDYYKSFDISDISDNIVTVIYRNNDIGIISHKIKRPKSKEIKNSDFAEIKCEFLE